MPTTSRGARAVEKKKNLFRSVIGCSERSKSPKTNGASNTARLEGSLHSEARDEGEFVRKKEASKSFIKIMEKHGERREKGFSFYPKRAGKKTGAVRGAVKKRSESVGKKA